MNHEIRSWVWGSTPVGCLAKAVIMVLIPIVIGLWGFDQYLHWQVAQRAAGRPDSPALAHPIVLVSVDLSHPLTVVGLVLLLVLVVVLVRRWAPQQLQQRLYRGLQILGGILALLQPGLLLGAAITAVICRERPRAFRFLIRGCTAIPAILMLAFGGWCWGWSLLVLTGRVSIAQALAAALVEVLLGGFWLRLYVDLTSTAEAEMKIAKLGKRMQARFERAAGAKPINPPFWQRTRRHPEGSVDLGVDRVRGRGLRVPIASLRRHATLVGVTASGKTVTIARIIDGVLSQPLPWAVIVVDCKGGELQDTAEDLARTHDVPFQEVNAGRPGSLRYDITQLGSPAEIADKLTAAFPSTPEAGIALGAAGVYAAVVDASGAIHGCYSNAAVRGQHAVKLTDGPCPPNTTAISWNQQGPPGRMGPGGPAGPQGAPGPAGPSGVSGYEIVQVFGAPGATSATAYCPAGKKVLGGGGQVLNSPNGSLTGTAPYVSAADGIYAWVAQASPDSIVRPDSSVEVWAMCAYAQ